jgi:hypothetical protein
MRSVITCEDRLAGGGLVRNPELSRLARHYGFRVRVCRPYRAKTKGRWSGPFGICLTISMSLCENQLSHLPAETRSDSGPYPNIPQLPVLHVSSTTITNSQHPRSLRITGTRSEGHLTE